MVQARGIEPWELAVASEEQKRDFLKCAASYAADCSSPTLTFYILLTSILNFRPDLFEFFG